MSPSDEALAPGVASLVELCAAVAAREPRRLDDALAGAAAEADPAGVEEALLQLHLFLGFPAALEAFRAWRVTSGRPAPAGVDRREAAAARAARGREVCARVYAGSYGRLRDNVRRLHPALERWMVEDGYGKVLARPGLGLADRELCIVGMLAVTAREPQLHSHLRGALNAGASPEAVGAALEIGLSHASGGAWHDRARALWRHVRNRHAPGSRTPPDRDM